MKALLKAIENEGISLLEGFFYFDLSFNQLEVKDQNEIFPEDEEFKLDLFSDQERKILIDSLVIKLPLILNSNGHLVFYKEKKVFIFIQKETDLLFYLTFQSKEEKVGQFAVSQL